VADALQVPTLTLPPLARPDTLAHLLGVTATNPRAAVALDLASARFRAAAGWRVDHGEAVETLDGHGRVSVRLRARHVTACTVTLVEHGVTRQLVDGVHYEWSTDGIIDRLGGVWPNRRRCVLVTYAAGYAPVPDDVAGAVLEQAVELYRSRASLSSKQVGGITETYITGVTQQWSTAVAAYRIGDGDRA